MEEKKEDKKEFLINLMLEAKRIELTSNRQNFFFIVKNAFSKQKPKEEIIDALKRTLEKKEKKELEYMITSKEGSLSLLKKRITGKKEKEKITELLSVSEEIKKGQGKREKIGREIGLKKKEIDDVEEKLPEKKEEIKEKTIMEKTPEKQGKKIIKRKRALRKKPAKIQKKKAGKKEIAFTFPQKELKDKKETEISSKRKKAIEEFHNDFTSGKSLINIQGNAKIISGTEKSRTEAAEARQRQENTDDEIEFDISKTKEKIKNLKTAFFHRQINEEDYKKKLFEYQEELNSLEMEKNRPRKKVFSRKPQKEFREDTGLKTIQEESVQFATRHTKESRKKIKEALKKFNEEFSTKKQPTETVQAKQLGIIKRIAPETNEKQAEEMEEKLLNIMQKNKIGESQMRREFEFVSPNDLMKRFDKILDAIQEKYSKKEEPETIKDKIFEEGAFVTNKKKEEKAEIKEIKESRITTDFDKLLELVKRKGKINEKEAMKYLGLNAERIKECYTVLEKNNLVSLEYPVFGGVKIFSKDYVEPKKQGKKVVK